MNEHHPDIRALARDGSLWIRDGLSACFYMPRSHSELARSVLHSIEAYRRAVGPQALSWYAGADGEWQRFDERVWEHLHREMLEGPSASVRLISAAGEQERYLVDYLGKSLDPASIFYKPEEVCAVSYWLPDELLERHGPQKMRELMLELAAPLPFSSGNAGLSFNCHLDESGVDREVLKYCFRYPGMDVLHPSMTSLRIGTRVHGPSWLTFLGQPVLCELGGVSGLRSRLHTPGTTVQELEGDRAVVTLGPWPEAGDTEQGKDLPAYRELARVLEPWTCFGENLLGLDPDEARRWERRFLD
ncbi:DUF3396 domain-containing protein [Myxococcus sp. RHSTA-1-4]|uniref:DUF3396 domain-containing protein n=1 Tax=Myxococcus sp. RHSTA-1-4 TaxID=2874601 RepID=UPI001CED1CFC|nr:DUF3396 domain-containing protein [Myxococcus sp. RHSTA-1-4]MBZ4419389.1 DUF3396 domain-containing protein [Myxococcus sp. RHSTA-1-4]